MPCRAADLLWGKYAHLGIIVRFTMRFVGDGYDRRDGRRRLRQQQGGSDLMSFWFARITERHAADDADEGSLGTLGES